MTARGPTVLLYGILGRMPFAGVAWQVMHFLEGLRRLGCDVYYVEDTGEWPYDPERNEVTADCGFTVRYIGELVDRCGLRDRWAYRAASRGGEVLGLPGAELGSLLRRADALINLCGATVLSEEHLRVPVRIYLETDPVLPQIEIDQGRTFTHELLSAHTHHFSYGENLGAPDCGVPVDGFDYQPTRQPVVTEWWSSGPPRGELGGRFTTIASWRQTGKDIQWRGETYRWSKHEEFLKLLDLPERSGHSFRLALAAVDASDLDLLARHRWETDDALRLSRDADHYRRFIQDSRGEFTVAKDQNVRLRSGWFSDRSATYLAAGRPVITQDTGFGRALPTGRGLHAFRDLGDVMQALDAIESDYAGSCRAAREIAEEHFAAERVLGRLLQRAGL